MVLARPPPATWVAVLGGRHHGMIEAWRYSVAVSCYARPAQSAAAASIGTSSDSRSIASSGRLRIRDWSSTLAKDCLRYPVHPTASQPDRFGSGYRSVTCEPSTNVSWWRE